MIDSEKPPDRPPRTRPLSTVILVVSVLVLVWMLTKDASAIDLVRRLNPVQLGLLVGLQMVYLVPHTYRYWVVVSTATRRRIPFLVWFRLTVIARSLNLVFTQAGNVYRARRLKKQYGVTYANYISAFFMFTWISTILNLVAAVILIVAVKPSIQTGWQATASVLVALLLVVIAGPFLATAFVTKFTKLGGQIGWLARRTSQAARSAELVLRSPESLYRFLVAAVGGLVIALGVFSAAFASLDLTRNIAVMALFFVLLQLSMTVQLTPGNLGVRELAFAVISSQIGIGAAEGALVAAVIRVTGLVALTVLALLLGGHKALASVRSIESGEGDPT